VLTLPAMDAPHLARAMRMLLGHPAAITALAAAARQRSFRTWQDYARDLTAWMATLVRSQP
jgi:hypothetical protein